MGLRAGAGRRSRIAGTGALLLVAAVAGVVVAGVVVAGSGGGTAGAGSPTASSATTTIVRQDLVEIDTEDGTLGYADSRPVINHLSGTITWLPAQGQVIRPDHTLYKIDAAPVILLAGSVPAYRTLNSSASGPDVRELERNLRRLGYDPGHAITVDETWTAATTTAVERFQKAHGITQSGSLALGQIVFLPGPRRVESLNGNLGGSATGGGSGAGASTSAAASTSTTSASSSSTSSNASASVGSGRAQLVNFVVPTGRAGAPEPVAHAAQTTTTPTTTSTTPTTTTPTSTTPTTTTPTSTTPTTTTPTTTPTTTTPATRPTRTTPTPTTPSSQTPTRAGTSGPTGGGSAPRASAAAAGGGASTPAAGASTGASAAGSATANTIMTTTSTRRVVTVDLATTKSGQARDGAPVTVQLPSGSYVHGRISAVGKVATAATSTATGGSSSSSSSGATIKVTIRLSSHGSSLDQAPVTVRFEQSRVKNALAIPVTALLARAGGTFAVEVVERHPLAAWSRSLRASTRAGTSRSRARACGRGCA